MTSPSLTSLIDTNILLRFILNDHPEQSPRTRRLMQDIALGDRRTRLVHTVVFESVYTLEKFYGEARASIRIAFLGLFDLDGMVVEDLPLLEETFERWIREPSLSFADSYHLSLAKSLGLTEIISFDRKIARDPAITRIEP